MRDDILIHQHSRSTTGWLTMVLALLACAAVEVAMHGMDRPSHAGWYVALVLACGLIAMGLGEVLRRRFPQFGATGSSRLSWLSGIVIPGVAIEALIGECLQSPMLLDILLLVIFRDIVIALAMLSHHEEAQRTCNAFATFLIVFASASLHAFWIQGLVVVFALIGVWWLMGTHWESLQQNLAATSDHTLPRKWLLFVPLVLLGVLVSVPVASRHIHALDGFMPTSGGQQDSSSMARSGIGDGDALVAGMDNIRSFAPIENAPFVNSHEPTLYDVYDDMYNEPVLQKKHQRAISLPPQTSTRPENHSIAKSSRPSRDFSTVRKAGKPNNNKIHDLDSRALFYVKGRVPLHLKLESFDRYDGVDWRAEELPTVRPRLSIEMVHKRPWLRTAVVSAFDFFAVPESHAIKVVDLDTSCIPTPNELTGVHIDQVAQIDFYRWERPGVIGIDQPKLPDLLTVQLQSRLVDPRLFRRTQPYFQSGPEGCRQFSDDPHSQQIRTLAESWVTGVPAGWGQIERVIDRIRSEHTLNSTAPASSDSTHSVAEFLLGTRRGPDYLFASAAVWALRSLGYTARLASGFYADPRRYEARLDHTPVMGTDVHFWVEAHVGLGHWITLDPTPGYVVLAPPLSLAEKTLKLLVAIGEIIVRFPLTVLAVCLGIALFVHRRRVIVDAIDEVGWRLLGQGDGRKSVVRTLVLLDRRCRRAGLPRPCHKTHARWLTELSQRMAVATPAIRTLPDEIIAFARLADQALYSSVFVDQKTEESCRLAQQIWSWKHVTDLVSREARPANSHLSARHN